MVGLLVYNPHRFLQARLVLRDVLEALEPLRCSNTRFQYIFQMIPLVIPRYPPLIWFAVMCRTSESK